MKKVIYILAFLLLTGVGFAQQELWPTADAEWYYTISDEMTNYGFSHYQIERDTVLLGKNSQIYSRETKTKFTGLPFDTVYHSLEDIYFIVSLEDSVLYNFSFDRNEFDTLIDFKAAVGSHWKTYYQDETCAPGSESFFYTEVLDKEIETVNGLDLLKFTFRRIVPEEGDTLTDIFYQFIGGVNGHFVYNQTCYAVVEARENLRCFLFAEGQNNEYVYKVTSQDCESLSSLSIENTNKLNEILIVNPVIDNIIRIHDLNLDLLEKLVLLDNSGKEIKVLVQVENEMVLVKSRNKLEQGIYHCIIQYYNGQGQIKKIVVQN